MRKNTTRRPELVTCRNPKCGRLLKLSDYISRSDSSTNCHYAADPQLAGERVICTCGHYTVFYDPAEERPRIDRA